MRQRRRRLRLRRRPRRAGPRDGRAGVHVLEAHRELDHEILVWRRTLEGTKGPAPLHPGTCCSKLAMNLGFTCSMSNLRRSQDNRRPQHTRACGNTSSERGDRA